MPGQEQYKIDFNPQKQYGGNTYRHTGNAVAVPEPQNEVIEEEEYKPVTLMSWVKSNVALLIIIGVMIATVTATCFMHNRMVTSNNSYATVQEEVEQLKRDASAGRETYNKRLADTDVEAIAEDELGMIPSEAQTDITLSQLPR